MEKYKLFEGDSLELNNLSVQDTKTNYMSKEDIRENDNSSRNEEAEDTAESTEEETIEEKPVEETEEETNDDKKGDKKIEEDSEDDEESDEEDSKKNYRPKSEQPDESVPLKKYLKVKKELSTLKKEREDDGEDLSTEDLDSLAEKYDLEPKALKELAKVIEHSTLKKAQKIIAPIQAKAMEGENEKAFNADFEKTILSKYPHLASKKEQFKKIAFSPDFVHLNNLEAIRKEFFADIEPPKKKEKDAPEGGSRGSLKVEEIDFDNMTEEQHARVLDDPVLRKKYYAHQDAKGL